MAAETKKKSASSDNDASEVKVGGTEAPARLGSLRSVNLPASRSKKVLLGLIVIVVLGVGFWLVYDKTHFGEKVYAQAAGHKIYKQDVENLIGKNKGISNHDAAEILADKYLYEAMAKEQGIKVTDNDIEAAYGSSINQQKTQNKYAYQSRVNDLYYAKLQAKNQGVYKGYLLVGQFSRNIELRPQPKDPAYPTNIGNPVAIAADKQYAKDFITNLYDQIQARKITWDQAATMEKADLEIGTNMYPSLSHSGPFDTAKNLNSSVLVPTSAQVQIQKLKAGQTSKPFVVTVVSTVGNENKSFESYYLVVRMDSSSGGGSTQTFVQEVTQAKKKLGYKVYV
jgi:hypothetical protein